MAVMASPRRVAVAMAGTTSRRRVVLSRPRSGFPATTGAGNHPRSRRAKRRLRSRQAGRGAARLTAAEQAAAQERPLQRAVAVHAAAAEPGDLPGGEQAGYRAGGAAPAEHLAGQVD